MFTALTQEEWAHFSEHFPEATAWLIAQKLQHEWSLLQSIPHGSRTDAAQKRLQALEEWRDETMCADF